MKILIGVTFLLFAGAAVSAGAGGPCGNAGTECAPGEVCYHENCIAECVPQPPGIRRCESDDQCGGNEVCSEAGFCFLPYYAPSCR